MTEQFRPELFDDSGYMCAIYIPINAICIPTYKHVILWTRVFFTVHCLLWHANSLQNQNMIKKKIKEKKRKESEV
jgi:hypothetical protein